MRRRIPILCTMVTESAATHSSSTASTEEPPTITRVRCLHYRVCQAFYIEVTENQYKLRRQAWEQRLDEDEAFEAAVAAAATVAHGV